MKLTIYLCTVTWRLQFEAYFSPDSDLSTSLAEARSTLRALLDEYVQNGRGRVVVQYFDPHSDNDLRDKVFAEAYDKVVAALKTEGKHERSAAVGEVKAAAIEALTAGRIAGAGLDVYVNEPNVAPELLALDNVTLLPHVGSATDETRTAMGMLAVDNVEAFLAGHELPSRVV